MEKFIQMYCGCGKGKTAAALGWSIMRASEGKSVFLVSFLKGKSTYSKEYLQRLEPEIQIFTFDRYERNYDELTESEQEDEKAHIRTGINFARKVLDTDECDVLVLDEILDLEKNHLVTFDELKELIRAADGEMELILTGSERCRELWPDVDKVTELDTIHSREK